jgi:hypothetical protein
MLRRLEDHREDFNHLFDIQLLLIKLIRRTERKIAALRNERSRVNATLRIERPPKALAALMKTQIEDIDAKVADSKHLLYFWRCFGDGIAYLYLDKHALKHTLFKTHDYSRKESPGALSGKIGFRRERGIVKVMCARGVPALLCDLTNTIRFGDVCPLVGRDPMPIEIKSSDNRNARVDRQIDALTTLHNFFESDVATNFRGLPRLRRVEIGPEEVTRTDEINTCIEAAKDSGFAHRSPEPGLHYVCLRETGNMDDFNDVIPRDSIVTYLNRSKSNETWMPYYPFTLSIREPQDLYNFMNGDMTLFVAVHVPTMVEGFAARGLFADVSTEDDDYLLTLSRLGSKPPTDPFVKLSKGLFLRIAHEFQSLEWFVKSNTLYFNKTATEGPHAHN